MTTKACIGTRFFTLQKTLTEFIEQDWVKLYHESRRFHTERNKYHTRIRHIVGLDPLPKE